MLGGDAREALAEGLQLLASIAGLKLLVYTLDAGAGGGRVREALAEGLKLLAGLKLLVYTLDAGAGGTRARRSPKALSY